MNKKTLSLVAMIVSILIVFFGILVMAGAMGGDTTVANGSYNSSSYLYDSGYAEFGADFYTYVSNNAAAAADAAESAASAARTVASNLDDIAALLKSACGIFLMGFGLLSLCHFGMIWLGEKKEEAEQEPVEAPEVEAEPAQEETADNEVISF